MISSRREGKRTGRVLRASPVIAVAAFIALCFVGFTPTHAATGDPAPALSEEDEICLSCHGSEGMETELASGETLSLHIRDGAFAASVHGSLGCTGCHMDVDAADHSMPATIDSRRAYSVQASEVCLQCHPDETLKEGPAHHARVLSADGPACAECHQVHSITNVAQWKAGIGETAYCLTCHGQTLAVRLEDGGSRSLSVDQAALRKSVHLNHECTSCHGEYSKDFHTAATSAGKRERSIVLAETCGQCHEDKFLQYEGSIHATLAKTGDLAAPVCTDCHGSHSVGPKAAYETLAGVPCKNCHDDIFTAYIASSHGQARGQADHIKAPICAGCHRAHDVSAAAAGAQLRDACLGCHENTVVTHEQWLPNTGLHFEAVSCPACHAPMARRRINLTLYDGGAKRAVSEHGGLPLFEERLRSIDTDGDGLDAKELWNLVRQINREGSVADMTLRGRMEVRSGAEAHQLSWKAVAVRNCESCHREGAEPFENVTISIVRSDGREMHFGADKKVLSSILSVDSVRGFYAIGGTRIALLDVLLVVVVLGGAAVPIGHMAMRRFFRKDR